MVKKNVVIVSPLREKKTSFNLILKRENRYRQIKKKNLI